jgi:hypothetical protein
MLRRTPYSPSALDILMTDSRLEKLLTEAVEAAHGRAIKLR